MVFYPASVYAPEAVLKDGDVVRAEHVNALRSEMIAVQSQLGTNPGDVPTLDPAEGTLAARIRDIEVRANRSTDDLYVSKKGGSVVSPGNAAGVAFTSEINSSHPSIDLLLGGSSTESGVRLWGSSGLVEAKRVSADTVSAGALNVSGDVGLPGAAHSCAVSRENYLAAAGASGTGTMNPQAWYALAGNTEGAAANTSFSFTAPRTAAARIVIQADLHSSQGLIALSFRLRKAGDSSDAVAASDDRSIKYLGYGHDEASAGPAAADHPPGATLVGGFVVRGLTKGAQYTLTVVGKRSTPPVPKQGEPSNRLFVASTNYTDAHPWGVWMPVRNLSVLVEPVFSLGSVVVEQL